MDVTKKKAVVLFSGGADSTTVLAIAKREGYDVYALSFNYQQRHKIELERAKLSIMDFAIKDHKIINIDLRTFGGSALTDDIDVPKNEYNKSSAIPVTYVPARNTIFLSYALAWAETIGASNIFIGANIVDYSNYPDCRPEYLSAFEKMANLATIQGLKRNAIKIHAPLINFSKAEIIKIGLELGVNYAHTISCYDPDEHGNSCGCCDSCSIRLEAFKMLNRKDPVNYVE